MQLFYYKNPIGNFGDDLNPWIWNTLAPEIFDDDDSEVLVGIGTLINTRAPEAPVKYVFGSGVGYHGFPAIDEKWRFYCVRGPLSAQRLNLDKSYAITDPAVLLTQLPDVPNPEKKNTVCYMPHHASSAFADWRDLCGKAGIVYMDPADDMRATIKKIRESRLVIAEAMHAAIVADAFRVPWIPVAAYEHILEFKWQDWCYSLDMNYRPEKITSIWDMERKLSSRDLFKTRLKRGLHSIGIRSENWTPPVPKTNRHEVEDQVVNKLIDLSRREQGCLSADSAHRESVERLLDKLELLKKAHAKYSGMTPSRRAAN